MLNKLSSKMHEVADRIEQSKTEEKVSLFVKDATEAYQGFKTARKEHR